MISAIAQPLASPIVQFAVAHADKVAFIAKLIFDALLVTALFQTIYSFFAVPVYDQWLQEAEHIPTVRCSSGFIGQLSNQDGQLMLEAMKMQLILTRETFEDQNLQLFLL